MAKVKTIGKSFNKLFKIQKQDSFPDKKTDEAIGLANGFIPLSLK